jgi:uncharacterized YigZ family protein
MSDSYKIVYEGGVGEIEEKKSRFIAYVKPVDTEEEAQAFIDEIKKKNWDARHNCAAAVIGKNNEYSRCNDDGEPAGTAGKPMLEVLIGEGVHNVVVVVTRYFGGVLLGTGGLVRAYQAAVKAGLAASKVAEKRQGVQMTLHTDYNGIGKIQYIMGSMGITCVDTRYTEAVEVDVVIPAEQEKEFVDKVTEGTAGRTIMDRGSDIEYIMVDGECVVC